MECLTSNSDKQARPTQSVQHPHGSTNQHSKYDRYKEQGCAGLRLLERMRKAARECETPSTAELQNERIYGLRPVNRLGDLIKGRYNNTRYDIEKIDCGHGVYRWRLHEPNRPGYPKTKEQGVLPLPAPSAPIPTPWKDRKPVTGLELFDAAVR